MEQVPRREQRYVMVITTVVLLCLLLICIPDPFYTSNELCIGIDIHFAHDDVMMLYLIGLYQVRTLAMPHSKKDTRACCRK